MLKNTNKELAIAVALLLKENSENRYKVIIESSGNILLKLTSNNWNFHAQSISEPSKDYTADNKNGQLRWLKKILSYE